MFPPCYRPDVIRKAVVAEEANKRQPYGSKPGAGIRHSVSTWGKGRGVARVQRLTQGAKAAESPNNVGRPPSVPPEGGEGLVPEGQPEGEDSGPPVRTGRIADVDRSRSAGTSSTRTSPSRWSSRTTWRS